jgi:hypothetical protein
MSERKQRSGIYIGPIADLKGKTALLMVETHYVQDMIPSHGQVQSVTLTAQFDDVHTGLGFGWHPFDIKDFDIKPEEDDGQPT